MKRKITWLVITGLTAAGTLAAISNRQYLMAQIGIEPPVAATTPQAALPTPFTTPQEAEALRAFQARQYAQQAFDPNQPAQFPAAGVTGTLPGLASSPLLMAPSVHTFAPGGQLATATTFAHPYYTSPASLQDEQRIQSLLAEYQSTSDQAKRKEAVDQITKTVNHQFEERQLVRERELKQLEERLAELKEKHAKRESLKEKIVSDRVEQLINNIDGLGWGNEPGPWLGQPVGAAYPSGPYLPGPQRQYGPLNQFGPKEAQRLNPFNPVNWFSTPSGPPEPASETRAPLYEDSIPIPGLPATTPSAPKSFGGAEAGGGK